MLRHMNLSWQKFLPFFIIAAAVILLVEGRKNNVLLPPPIELIPPQERSAENTEFTLPSLTGNMMELADFRGNVVLLNFFATWCPPCREEMPTIQAAFEAYRQRGFVVVGVSTDKEGKKVVEPFVKSYHMTFPVLLDAAGQVAQQYRVRGIPTIYLFDRRGRIAAAAGGGDWNSAQARAVIEQLLNEP